MLGTIGKGDKMSITAYLHHGTTYNGPRSTESVQAQHWPLNKPMRGQTDYKVLAWSRWRRVERDDSGPYVFLGGERVQVQILLHENTAHRCEIK